MAELKPCPFCGGNRLKTPNGATIAFIGCRDCGAEICRMEGEHFSPYDNPEKLPLDYAIEAWNRRAEDGAKTSV